MNTIVNEYNTRFEQAKTIEDKKAIANEFRKFYESLEPEAKIVARKAMQPLLDDLKNSFNDLDNRLNKIAVKPSPKKLKQYRKVA